MTGFLIRVILSGPMLSQAMQTSFATRSLKASARLTLARRSSSAPVQASWRTSRDGSADTAVVCTGCSCPSSRFSAQPLNTRPALRPAAAIILRIIYSPCSSIASSKLLSNWSLRLRRGIGLGSADFTGSGFGSGFGWSDVISRS